MDTVLIVTPAEAGVQGLERILEGSFKPWIPAFAGMTALPVCIHYLLKINNSRKIIDMRDVVNFYLFGRGAHVSNRIFRVLRGW